MYALPYEWVGNGQFFKINNRIYYVLGNDPTDPERENLAYDFTDMPFTRFLAYVVLYYLVDGYSFSLRSFSLQEDTRLSGTLLYILYWERAFRFLLDTRFQEECFRVLDLSNVCKIHILVAWTNLLIDNFKDQEMGHSTISPFEAIYSESSVEETCLKQLSVCNLLEFLGFDRSEAVSLSDKLSSCEGLKELIISLDRFLESQNSY